LVIAQPHKGTSWTFYETVNINNKPRTTYTVGDRLKFMKSLTTSEKEIILSRLFWDVDKHYVDYNELLDEKFRNIENDDGQKFFTRILTSCDWYTLLKLIPLSKVKVILSDPILNRLYPKELKDRYIYAKSVLSR